MQSINLTINQYQIGLDYLSVDVIIALTRSLSVKPIRANRRLLFSLVSFVCIFYKYLFYTIRIIEMIIIFTRPHNNNESSRGSSLIELHFDNTQNSTAS